MKYVKLTFVLLLAGLATSLAFTDMPANIMCATWGGKADCFTTSRQNDAIRAEVDSGGAAILNTEVRARGGWTCSYSALSYGDTRNVDVRITDEDGNTSYDFAAIIPGSTEWEYTETEYIVPGSSKKSVKVVMYEAISDHGEFTVANGANTTCLPPGDFAGPTQVPDIHLLANPEIDLPQQNDRGPYELIAPKAVMTTVFWVGEEEHADNGHISNHQSAWNTHWIESYGGIDTPDDRCGFYPCGFFPKENPFYAALPYNDLDINGQRKDSAQLIPWYEEFKDAGSLMKNQWLAIKYEGTTCYAQIEDAGPAEYDDFEYVFGIEPPLNTFGLKAGLDVSPAVRDCLGMQQSGITEWWFVHPSDVPAGPWKETVTNSGTYWR